MISKHICTGRGSSCFIIYLFKIVINWPSRERKYYNKNIKNFEELSFIKHLKHSLYEKRKKKYINEDERKQKMKHVKNLNSLIHTNIDELNLNIISVHPSQSLLPLSDV